MPAWVEQGYADYAGRLPKDIKLELVEIPLGQRGKNADITSLYHPYTEDQRARMDASMRRIYDLFRTRVVEAFHQVSCLREVQKSERPLTRASLEPFSCFAMIAPREQPRDVQPKLAPLHFFRVGQAHRFRVFRSFRDCRGPNISRPESEPGGARSNALDTSPKSG